jgi:hypothetical protein
MAPRAGVEPAASPLGGVRSILLSYRGSREGNPERIITASDGFADPIGRFIFF